MEEFVYVDPIATLEFLSCARVTLEEIAPDHEEYVEFIRNEATDYEIMHALIRNHFPERKIDVMDEALLYEELQEIISENYDVLEEQMSINGLEKINEIGFIEYESSSIPLTEGMLLQELDIKGMMDKMSLLKRQLAQAVNPSTKNQLRLQIKKLGMQIKKSKEAMKAPTKLAVSRAKDIGKFASDAAKAAGKATYQTGKEFGQAAGQQVKAVGKTGSELVGKTGIQALRDIGKKSGAAGIAKKIGISGKTAQTAGGAGVLAIVALLAFGAYQTYKRFFSKAARACKGKEGPARKKCLLQNKIKALNAQVKDYQSGMKACEQSKNPTKCKTAVMKKIDKIKKKIAKESDKFAKLPR